MTRDARVARIEAVHTALKQIDDPVDLARMAATALAHIDETREDSALHAVLTELTHTARALSDAAQRAAGVNDLNVSTAMWQLTGAIGTHLTDDPLPVLRGEPLQEN